MGKKRTRKQKLSAKHNFTFTVTQDGKFSASPEPVKGQIKTGSKEVHAKTILIKNANNLDKEVNLASIKKELVKSLGFASLILALELVLYFIL